jgi:hypothetical protein
MCFYVFFPYKAVCETVLFASINITVFVNVSVKLWNSEVAIIGIPLQEIFFHHMKFLFIMLAIQGVMCVCN